MKALVFLGQQHIALEDRPVPELLAPTDAIVRVRKTTLCGTDLHILKGDVPTVDPGRILGHEGVGDVVQTGDAVTAFKDKGIKDAEAKIARYQALVEKWNGLVEEGTTEEAYVALLQSEIWDKVDLAKYPN